MSDTAPGAVAWFNCFAGIAGDMALGSLLNAGADLGEVRSLLDRLPLPGWDLRVEEALRGGIACTRVVVSGDDVVVRTHGAIAELISAAALPPRVTERALTVFQRLAVVESALHRRPVDQVHFHEVGGHDAVIDIVGTVAALEVLGIDEVSASAVATGSGTVRSAHGFLPNPAPATVRLLRGVPTYGRDVRIELTTPTGAALLATLCTSFGPLPPMTITGSGFGGGTAEMDELPNCSQVVIGQPGPVGYQPQHLVLGGDRPGRLQPGDALQRGAGDHHVEQQRRFGRSRRDEGEEPRTVAGDDRGGQLVHEEREHFLGVVAAGADQPGQLRVERLDQPAVVERDGLEGQALPARRKDEICHALVVAEH